MKVKITMVSGETHEFENTRYKKIEDWIKNNFEGSGDWYMISPELDFVINIKNIEKIEGLTK